MDNMTRLKNLMKRAANGERQRVRIRYASSMSARMKAILSRIVRAVMRTLQRRVRWGIFICQIGWYRASTASRYTGGGFLFYAEQGERSY